jgi:hypothetical protein
MQKNQAIDGKLLLLLLLFVFVQRKRLLFMVVCFVFTVLNSVLVSVTNLCLEWVHTRSDSTVQQQETTKHKDRQEVMRDAIAYVRTKRTAREVRMPQCFYS